MHLCITTNDAYFTYTHCCKLMMSAFLFFWKFESLYWMEADESNVDQFPTLQSANYKLSDWSKLSRKTSTSQKKNDTYFFSLRQFPSICSKNSKIESPRKSNSRQHGFRTSSIRHRWTIATRTSWKQWNSRINFSDLNFIQREKRRKK